MGDPGIGKCAPRGTYAAAGKRAFRPLLRTSGIAGGTAALPTLPAQLTLVMVQPQRGHSEPCPERQVVPQWEQVEAVAAFPALTQPQA